LLAVAIAPSFRALSEKRQQLGRGAKTQLTARIDFLDPAFEFAFAGACRWSESEDKPPSHY
jgi:hypothetical protein